MNQIIVLGLLIILISYISKFILNRKTKYKYIKAGRKWDGIVEELRRRK